MALQWGCLSVRRRYPVSPSLMASVTASDKLAVLCEYHRVLRFCFGVVSHVGAGAVPTRVLDTQGANSRWMTVELLGEGERGADFRRGISQYPTVGDQVHLVTDGDLARIYGAPDSPNFVRVGHLSRC